VGWSNGHEVLLCHEMLRYETSRGQFKAAMVGLARLTGLID